MRKMILSAIAMSLFRWLTKPKPGRPARTAGRKPARQPASAKKKAA